MIKRLLALMCFISSICLNAQTGIGTITPNPSAKLDVYSTNKGFLPPRVTLTSATDASTIASPAEGLLVYNLGSVGLQAGYYYWNGANWATIATASSAGNGVTAMDMVKLYSKAYSAASGDIAHSGGYVFTVPVSGRYLFDFSCTAFSSNTEFTQYFKVRQGTTDLATDAQTVTNNGVRVEYNGKVEVNLQSGVSYNVYVTGGSRNSNDYDRVYYKLVAGNLPVTGQTVDYVSVTRTGSDQTVNTGNTVVFNTINGGNIPYNTSTGLFTLTAGKTYKLTGVVSLSNGNTVAKEVNIVWKNAAGDVLGSKGELLSPSAAVDAAGNGTAFAIYTPTSNTTVSLNVNYSSSNTILWQNFTFASIEQVGSSAIVNPWVLSGNDVYNTTGNVGIGTSAPTSKLDVTGNVNVAGALNVSGSSNVNIQTPALLVGNGSGDEGGEIQLASAQTNQSLNGRVIVDVYRNQLRFLESGGSARGVNIDLSKAPNGASGELIWKASGFVPAGTFVSLDNLKASVTTVAQGNRGLSIGAVSTTFEADVSGWYTVAGGSGGGTANNITYTISASGSAFGWNFPTHGDMVQVNLRDKTNNRFYRITMMIGASYISDFISIERLF